MKSFTWLIMIALGVSIVGGCHATGRAVQKTGHGVEKAGNKIENAGKK